jgi:hypothetical protein
MRDKSEIKENQLLAALPPEVLERLLPSLENVVLPPGEILLLATDEAFLPNALRTDFGK